MADKCNMITYKIAGYRYVIKWNIFRHVPLLQKPQDQDVTVKRPPSFLKIVFHAARMKEPEEIVIGINLLNGHLTDRFHEFRHIFFHHMESDMKIHKEASNQNITSFKRINKYLVFIYLDFELIFFTLNGEVFHEENSGDRCNELGKEKL